METVIQRYFAASRGNNKVEEMAACFAEDCVIQDPVESPPMRGQTELRQFLQTIVNLFATVELTEEFGKNGREVTFEGIDVFEQNAAGKIQSLRGYWNPAAMLATLQGDS
jgi:steroid Delta-isomerase